MQDLLITLLLMLVAGLIGGFLSGLLGIGGGIIYVFILTYIYQFHFQVGDELGHYVIANSLFVIFLSTLYCTFQSRNSSYFYPNEIIKIAIPSTIASVLLTLFVVNKPFFKPITFDVITILVLVYILIMSLARLKKKDQNTTDKIHSNKVFIISGVTAGILSAVTGLGGGTILTPILNGKFKLRMIIVRHISLGVIMISSLVVTITNAILTPQYEHGKFTVGYINVPLGIILGIGAIFSSHYGVKVGNKLSASKILKLFTAFIFLLIVKKLIEVL